MKVPAIRIRTKTPNAFMVLASKPMQKQIEKKREKLEKEMISYNVYAEEGHIVHSLLPLRSVMSKKEVERYRNAINDVIESYKPINKKRGRLGKLWQKIKEKGRKAVGINVEIFETEVEVLDK